MVMDGRHSTMLFKRNLSTKFLSAEHAVTILRILMQYSVIAVWYGIT